MGLFDVVDSFLGTDLTGKKAAKHYEQGAAAMRAANQRAVETMKEYGIKTMADLREYASKAQQELQTGYGRAGSRVSEGIQNAIQAITENTQNIENLLNEGYGNVIDQIQDTGRAAQEITEDYLNRSQEALTSGYEGARRDVQQGFGEAQAAREPYRQATETMLGAADRLAAAQGLPGAGSYDVKASPMYQWQKEQMDKELTAQMNAMGLQNVPASAQIRSENLSRLGAEESQRQLSSLYNMAGMGLQAGQSLGNLEAQQGQVLGNLSQNQGNALAQLLAQTGGNLSNIAMQTGVGATNAGMGQTQALAQNRGNFGQNLGNLYMQEGSVLAGQDMQLAQLLANLQQNLGMNLGNVNMGIGSNIANSQIAGGQSAMNMGIARAQQPNPLNQLLNTGISLFGMGAFSGGGQQPQRNLTPIAQSNYQNYGMPMMMGMSGIGGI